MTKAEDWQDPGVEMFCPPVMRPAAIIVVFSRESVCMRLMHASDVLLAPARIPRSFKSFRVSCNMQFTEN